MRQVIQRWRGARQRNERWLISRNEDAVGLATLITDKEPVLYDSWIEIMPTYIIIIIIIIIIRKAKIIVTLSRKRYRGTLQSQ